MQSSYNLVEWFRTLFVRRVLLIIRAYARFQNVVVRQDILGGVAATTSGVITLFVVRSKTMRMMTMKTMVGPHPPHYRRIQMSRWLPYEDWQDLVQRRRRLLLHEKSRYVPKVPFLCLLITTTMEKGRTPSRTGCVRHPDDELALLRSVWDQ
jgi:hypothetical protein